MLLSLSVRVSSRARRTSLGESSEIFIQQLRNYHGNGVQLPMVQFEFETHRSFQRKLCICSKHKTDSSPAAAASSVDRWKFQQRRGQASWTNPPISIGDCENQCQLDCNETACVLLCYPERRPSGVLESQTWWWWEESGTVTNVIMEFSWFLSI